MGGVDSQLEQCSVGIGVANLLFALLLEIGLEGTDSLGIVALEAVDNVGNVIGPLGRIFTVHLVGIEGVLAVEGGG